MTTPQNPYGPQARPAPSYVPPSQTSYPRHAAAAPQANAGPHQPYQAPMASGYAQHGGATGYTPQRPAQAYSPQGPAQAYSPQGPAQAYSPQRPAQDFGPAGYTGPASAAGSRQDLGAPAGLPQAGVPGQRSGEQPLPQYPTGGGQPPRAPRNGLGTTALVLGILAVLFAMIPIIGMIAWPLSILGLIFGVIGVVRTRSGTADNKGVAISGTVLSAIGLILCIVWVAAFSNAVATAPLPSTGSAPASSGSGTTQTAGAFPGATTSDVIAQPGETVTVGDMQVTATALKPGDSTLGKTLCTTVTYRYTGSTTGSFNGGFDWKLQDPAGAALMTGFTGSDKTLSAGQLAPGGTTTGDVCFDQNTAAPGQYVLLYDAMTFSSDRGAWLNQVG